MTAASAPINTPRYGAGAIPNQLHAPQQAGSKIYQGTIVCLEGGYATAGRTALALTAIGIAYCSGLTSTYDNTSGANGDLEVVVDQGVFPLKNSTSGDQLTQADAGKLCYIVDNQTVAKTSGGNTRSPCGRVVYVDSDGNVWVQIGLSRGVLGEAGSLGAAVVFTANDFAPAALVHDSTYDIPTIAAASTVTLPAAAPPGTRVYFTADGTKNGGTVTYRDATGPVALTTALLASKRHLAIALKGVTNWTVNAYVSP